MASVTDIEGVGEAFGEKLKEAGIHTVEALLEAGKTPKGRAEVAAKSGIGEHHILKWVNHADLFRINGVAGQFAELLDASGVDTVVELSHRVAEHLVEKMKEIDEAKHLTHRVPSLSEVQDWIEQAKKLPRAVEY
ncbi:MAG: DUF4332 domain-containing protein [Nocardioidaceae bacterium]